MEDSPDSVTNTSSEHDDVEMAASPANVDAASFKCPFKRPRLDDSDTLNELVSMIDRDQNSHETHEDQLEENVDDLGDDDEYDGEYHALTVSSSS